MDDFDLVERRQHYIPTYTRVWDYPWLIRGLPGGITFWRPIPGKAALTFIGVVTVEWFLFKLFQVQPGLYGGLVAYLGLPLLAGWYVTQARLGGKRLDNWVMDRIAYQVSPKQYHMFKPVEPDADEITMDLPVCIDDRPIKWTIW